MVTNRYKSPGWRSWVPPAVKVGTAVALLGALYYQLAVAQSFDVLSAELRARLASAPVWLPVLIVLLVPINLSLEALKFQLLLPRSRRPHFGEAIARVCAGLTVGMFTPNRVGEYLGRLTHAYPGERAATVLATLLGGAAQWIPMLWGGAVAAVCWPLLAASSAPVGVPQVIAAIVLGGVLLLGFARLHRVVEALGIVFGQIARRFPSDSYPAQRLSTFRTRLLSLGHAAAARPRELRWALALAWLRYAVYLSQLALAFAYCGLSAPPTAAVVGTAAILLAQTFLPLPAVLQALARVELAAFLWGSFAPNEVGLATASLLIFVLNLGLPAFVGLGVILRSDVAQTLGPSPLRELQRPGAGAAAGLVRWGD